ncbi:MAG TPA: 16S rRNA (cytosine(1402)-N(4))-methyltransferase RsmH [Candidatus Eisenbacteria bacterium]|nr:16S rRNA (cytosine(1402)-N(4))-methyltransferase RsmH [Candidatus Eisenbacteria bacterium]
MGAEHVPVLLKETIEGLRLRPNGNTVDCTVGAGGHAEAVLEATSPSGRLLGLDLDEAALDAARRNLERFGSRAMLVHESYRNIGRVLPDTSFGPVQAALLDLGFSSIEIDDPSRGFSFRFDAPLDMRFDRSQETTAAEIVNGWSLDDLARILWEYGEERFARKIADAIVRARRRERILTTFTLVDLIAHSVPAWYRRGKIHFATRTFQALRIAVNDELGNLRAALPDLLAALEPGGRLAVIAFHSLEDRIVKEFFKAKAAEGALTIITKRPIVASEGEIGENPRSRSAKLRVAEKA